jgi:hypothetical protein
MAEDQFVLPLAQALYNCLCAEIQNQTNPPGQCCFRVGVEIAHDAGILVDSCCDGIAYVSLGDTFPSSASFPEQDVVRQAQASCAPVSWAQMFKAGIIRCVPTGDENAPPTCGEWTEAFYQNVQDGLTLRRVQCCFRNFVRTSELFSGMSVVMERQIQGTPQGGCIERYFTIAVQFPNCDC